MRDKIKVMSIFGTRPEAIKMASVVKELEKDEKIESKVLITAQHRQMLDQVMDIFDMKADYDLNVMEASQTIHKITSKVLEGVGKIIEEEFRPDLVLVHGDTSTAFSSALSSFYMKVDVGHVEAGLRTDNIYSPFPEEMNRRLITRLSSINFCPTESNKKNLLIENVSEDSIVVTGNTVIDAMHMVIDDKHIFSDEKIRKVDFSKKTVLLTCHRRENWGSPMEEAFRAVADLSKKYPDLTIIYPVHLNPKIQELAKKSLNYDNIILTDPLEYKEFANLINAVDFVLTDSGGMQEEAPSVGVPVLVLREETERPEAVEAGTVKLVGTSYDKIMENSIKLLEDENFYNGMSRAISPYGDGKASKRIVEDIKKRYL